MSPSRLRFVWPTLCVLLALALGGSTIYWRQQLRAATAKKKEPTPQPVFDKRAAAFFRELAEIQKYQTKSPLAGADAARLAAYDRLELNRHWLLGLERDPATFSVREQTFPNHAVIPLASTIQFSLAEPLKNFRYELTNKSDHALPAPILFRDDRWDSATELVAQAGFKSIPDEVERAVAIWRFVCPRRVFGDPPTEGVEEHDVIKFFAHYGYGFCDDTARALATLAELSGLKSRVWELDGHVVAEVMANGRWRMLDADQQAYFHRAGAPLDILGVEELAAERAAFAHLVSFRNADGYPPKYIDCFLSKDDNKVSASGTAEHRIDPTLRAGEQMAFTNYNWGRYFLGKYPMPPARFYNGTFTYRLDVRDLPATKLIVTEPIESGWRLRNTTGETVSVGLPFSYPFPIVGGVIDGTPTVIKGTAQLRLEDSDHERSWALELRDNIHVELDHFVAVLTPEPTHRYAIVFTLGPQAVLELRDFKVCTDFQFARMALLPLAAGANEFHAYFPEKSKAGDFELTVSWR
jgi:hypothetical protein